MKREDINGAAKPQTDGYSLRYAAGSYWITDCGEADYDNYCAPVMVNETGAHMWRCFAKGYSASQTAEFIAGMYGIQCGQAYNDTVLFAEKLRHQGVKIL